MPDETSGVERRPGSAAAASETKRGARHRPHRSRRLRRAPAGSTRRTFAQRTLLSIGAIASAVLLVVAVATGYFNWRLGQINRLNLDLTSAAMGGPQNYLVVGSDSRKGIDANSKNSGAFLDSTQYAGNADSGGRRSDTIMILRVDPSSKTARLLSLPRDLYVPIAGKDHKDKINAAFGIGVPTLIQTIEDTFDLPINHYVEVDFVGFQHLVDAMGGVSLYFDKPMWDSHTGLDISTVGCHELNGSQALAFARSRYLWYNTSGDKSVDTSSLRYLNDSQMRANGWSQDGTSDLGRISRQQLLIRTAIPQAEHAAFKNPATLNAMMDTVVHAITVDSGLSTSNMAGLANRFRKFNPENLLTYSFPGTPATSPTAGSILEPDFAQGEKILAKFRDSNAGPQADVNVRVLNASGVDRQAANVAGALERVGFSIDSTGDASLEGIGELATTQVRYAPANIAAAKLVASHLSTPVELVPIAGASSVIEVVTGKDFTTVSTTPRALQPSELPAKTGPSKPSKHTSPSTTTSTVVGVIPDQVDTSCT